MVEVQPQVFRQLKQVDLDKSPLQARVALRRRWSTGFWSQLKARIKDATSHQATTVPSGRDYGYICYLILPIFCSRRK